MKDLHKRASNLIQLDHLDVVYDSTRSHGSYFYDSLHDRKLLDCFSFIASNPLGHNHPGLNTPEFEKKLLKVAKTNPSNADILTEEYVEFVETFNRVLNKGDWFEKYFFIAGGTLAVENALKTAFDWKYRLNLEKYGRVTDPDKMKVVYLAKSFHGRSGYALPMMHSAQKHKLFPKFPGWLKFDPEMDGAIEAMIHEIEHDKRTIAAIIIEPIRSEGGDLYLEPWVHQHLRELADSFECLLIYDEVQTGVGLTGKTWAFEHYGVVPDILCFGKKTQVCGIAVTDRVLSVKGNVFEEKSRLSSTFGGNLTDMVRCQRYLEIIEEENLINNSAVVGEYLLQKLKDLESAFPNHLSNVRGLGLMCAFDLLSKNLRNEFVHRMLKVGVLILGCGEVSVRFRPSLNFSKEDVDVLTQKLSEVLMRF